MKEEVENREIMAEEIPIEEFENDTQDFLEEFMKEFTDEEEEIDNGLEKTLKKFSHRRGK